MAMYNGREVSVNPQDIQIQPPQKVGVLYANGQSESVPLAHVHFTKDEKKKVKDTQGDPIENLKEFSDEDDQIISDKKAADKAEADRVAKENPKKVTQTQTQPQPQTYTPVTYNPTQKVSNV
jgi:hypothetical protein